MFNYNNAMYYSEEEVKLAIDIAVGDDGHTSEKAMAILKTLGGNNERIRNSEAK